MILKYKISIQVSLTACFFLFLTIPDKLLARPETAPPSISLRTELSHIAVATLTKIDTSKNNTSTLQFTIDEALHNQSEPKISIDTLSALANKLEANTQYIIAYQTHKRARDSVQRRYIPIASGPILLQEQGAQPAIFKYNALLKDQLTSDPQAAIDAPEAWIKNLFTGMQNPDIHIRTFFLRELINWTSLHDYLTPDQFEQLYHLIQQPTTNMEMLVAFYENRPKMSSGLGKQRLANKALALLQNLPVNFDHFNEQANLILLMLDFSSETKTLTFDTLARWVVSDHPAVVDKSLPLLWQIDKARTQELVKRHMKQTILPATVRRTMRNFIRTKK